MKVSEIAKICGVTEQSIRAYYQREHVTKIGGRWHPTDSELEALLAYYGVSNLAHENTGKNNETQDNASIIKLLEAQMATLQEQLEIKDRQISELQSTVNKQQDTICGLIETNKALAATNAVQVAADKKPLLVESEQSQTQEPSQETQEPQKKGFFARLFGL